MEHRITPAAGRATLPITARPRPGLAYNYAAYSFELERPELERWRLTAPRLAQPAPAFELESTDGTLYRLSDLLGRPVVIEFGSYTCLSFCGQVEAMEALARAHPEATFLVVYVREAHPGEKQRPHQSDEDKRVRALQLLLEEPVARPVLVDHLAGDVHRAWGGGWNPAFVLDRDGRVALRSYWNDPLGVEDVLQGLARGKVARREAVDFSPPPPRGPSGLELLSRGGRQALLDFYRSASTATQVRLEHSESPVVRAALVRLARTGSGDLH